MLRITAGQFYRSVFFSRLFLQFFLRGSFKCSQLKTFATPTALHTDLKICTYSEQCTYQRPSQGVDPQRTYGGMARDLLTFVANFGPRTGLTRRDTWGKTHEICNIAAILKMKDPDRGYWVYICSPV